MAKSSKGTSASNRGSQSGSAPASNKSMSVSSQGETSELLELFEHGLKDILWAEKALTKAIPKMVQNAENEELKAALEEHLAVTEGQIEKLNKVFEQIDKSPRAKKCAGMEGIITEGEEIMAEFEDKSIDAAIITAASKVEHYEMSSYMSLITLAMRLGLQKAATILEEIFLEEQDADKKLREMARTLPG